MNRKYYRNAACTMMFILTVSMSGVARAAGPELAVKALNLCRSITGEGMQGSADSFMEDTGTVCLWAELNNVEQGMNVIHSWYYGNRKQASIRVGVDHIRYVSQSCMKIAPEQIGIWKVKVFTLKKELLGEKEFFVKGIPDKPDRKKKKSFIVDLGMKASVKSRMKISEIKIGKNIKRGKLAGDSREVPSSWKKVYCWVNLPEVKEEDSTVKFAWYYFGKKMAESIVAIEAPADQAWAGKTMKPQYAGDWCVEVLDSKDGFIKEICFKVKP